MFIFFGWIWFCSCLDFWWMWLWLCCVLLGLFCVWFCCFVFWFFCRLCMYCWLLLLDGWSCCWDCRMVFFSYGWVWLWCLCFCFCSWWMWVWICFLDNFCDVVVLCWVIWCRIWLSGWDCWFVVLYVVNVCVVFLWGFFRIGNFIGDGWILLGVFSWGCLVGGV